MLKLPIKQGEKKRSIRLINFRLNNLFFGFTIHSWFCILIFFACSKKQESLSVIFAGDLMLDRGVREVIEEKSINFLFENVKPILKSSDFGIANFECSACDAILPPIAKKFNFRANPEWMLAIRENGISHVTLANNHSFDYGEEGIKQTNSNLNKVNIETIGFNAGVNKFCKPTLLKNTENCVAIFSSCYLKQNHSFTCNLNTIDLAKRIKAFKKVFPYYLVLISLHWGVEMSLKPTTEQVLQAHQLIDAGADAIIGHHPHVVQSIEVYRGRYIMYSLGNFIFDNSLAPANKGLLAKLSFAKGSIESIRIFPFQILASKPTLMNLEESSFFIKELGFNDHNLFTIQNDGSWKGKMYDE